MKLPLYWVDAFADKIFSGNPAAVVPLADWLPDVLMQQIAFENGLAETAFFVEVAERRYHLRWFTPAVEVDLCGHATLASAFVLFTQLYLAGDTVTFDSRSGPLAVKHQQNGLLELDFPSRPAQPCASSSALSLALGATPEHIVQARDTLCAFACEEEVLALKPDFIALAKLETYAVHCHRARPRLRFRFPFLRPRAPALMKTRSPALRIAP